MITMAALVVLFVAGCKKDPELPEDPYVPVYDQGSGTNEDPWLISNAEQLDSIRNNLSAHYRLIADIDLGNYLADTSWVPIGDESNNFNGVLDGNGHTIIVLGLHRSRSADTIGFFRYAGNDAVIKNLVLDDVRIQGSGSGLDVSAALAGINKGLIRDCSVRITTEGYMAYLGGLVGINEGAIAGCHVDVNIKFWTHAVGGLAYKNEGDILGCHASGKISSEGEFSAGGMVCFNLGTIRDSHSSVEIISVNQTLGSVGGFAGAQFTSGGYIRDCYSTGDIDIVTSIPPFYPFYDILVVGGFVGGHYGGKTGDIENCYTTGDVSVTMHDGDSQGTRIATGGFTGGGSNLTNCYAAGKVTGINTGGLVGADMDADVTSSYYDSEATGQNDTENGIPKTTIEMMQQATFEGWDFTSVWTIDEATSYPYLQWQ
ncbi:MAG: GLUG motif-containing protein [Bacteroidales bacterium]|nr:GLUG motif-containing protein [Bacteroidales bacterium]